MTEWMAGAGGFLLNGTRYGRYVQAIGSNEQTAGGGLTL